MKLNYPVGRKVRAIVERRFNPLLLLLNADCRVVSLQGDVSAYGFQHVSAGEDARDELPWLHGLALEDAFELKFVETPNGGAVNVHVFAVEALHGVLMTDASEQRDALRQTQQQANEIALLAERQKKLLAELEAARAQLEQRHRQSEEANRIKSRFIAGLSHEFRTPLASILGQADLLKDEDQDLTQGLLSIETNASHLLSLIDNILDQAKIDSGQMELRPAPTDLAHLTEQVKAIFSPIALQQGLELHIETSGLEGRFDIDALRLKQILINLLGNAVKFTQEGFVSLRIAVMNNRLSVAVADTGPGVSDAAKSRIFQAFHQEALHSSEGVGLGLAISFQLVQLMGGDLSVADREQGGSLFQFEILAPAATPMPAQTLGPALKILVADDSDDLRRLLLLHLEKGGHQTLEAANGSELLSLVDSAQPDMAIIDLYMGDEDGAELTRALRLRDYSGRILVLSASSMREDRQRVIDAGADAYLVKPVSAEALRRKVAELGRV